MRAFLVALALVLAACATPSSAQTSGAKLPAELQRVLDDYSVAWRAKDAKALAGLFVPGRTVVPNACPPATTAGELEKCYANSGSPIDLRVLDWRMDGSLAYIVGEYAGAAGGPAAGKYVLTLAKGAGGKWLIVADMDREYRRAPQ